jgi:hypothetical protein
MYSGFQHIYNFVLLNLVVANVVLYMKYIKKKLWSIYIIINRSFTVYFKSFSAEM